MCVWSYVCALGHVSCLEMNRMDRKQHAFSSSDEMIKPQSIWNSQPMQKIICFIHGIFRKRAFMHQIYDGMTSQLCSRAIVTQFYIKRGTSCKKTEHSAAPGTRSDQKKPHKSQTSQLFRLQVFTFLPFPASRKTSQRLSCAQIWQRIPKLALKSQRSEFESNWAALCAF